MGKIPILQSERICIKCGRVRRFQYNPKIYHSECKVCKNTWGKKARGMVIINADKARWIRTDMIKQQLQIFNDELSARKNKCDK